MDETSSGERVYVQVPFPPCVSFAKLDGAVPALGIKYEDFTTGPQLCTEYAPPLLCKHAFAVTIFHYDFSLFKYEYYITTLVLVLW